MIHAKGPRTETQTVRQGGLLMKKGRTIDPDGVNIREETYSLISCYYLTLPFFLIYTVNQFIFTYLRFTCLNNS